jgi:hypothetical protein
LRSRCRGGKHRQCGQHSPERLSEGELHVVLSVAF